MPIALERPKDLRRSSASGSIPPGGPLSSTSRSAGTKIRHPCPNTTQTSAMSARKAASRWSRSGQPRVMTRTRRLETPRRTRTLAPKYAKRNAASAHAAPTWKPGGARRVATQQIRLRRLEVRGVLVEARVEDSDAAASRERHERSKLQLAVAQPARLVRNDQPSGFRVGCRDSWSVSTRSRTRLRLRRPLYGLYHGAGREVLAKRVLVTGAGGFIGFTSAAT